MKTLKLISIGMVLFATNMAHSQVSIHVNFGLPVVRVETPVVQASVDYYYLPDVQAYYDVRATQYVYLNSGRWCRSNYLPGYRNYDVYHSNRVVLNGYHGSQPYAYYHNHQVNYNKVYRGNPNHYSYNERGHYENRGNHDSHENWKNDRGNHRH